jgi:photosystem II stability/assembly factor-like uncharacterized protein
LSSRLTSILARAAASLVLGLGAATAASAQEPSRLDFDRESVPVGGSVRLTFTIDPSLVGQNLKLLTGSNLGPSPMGDFMVNLGGGIQRRARFDATGPVTTLDLPVKSGFAGRTFLIVFVSSRNEIVSSSSNVIAARFDEDGAQFMQVPLSDSYGWVETGLGSAHNVLAVAFTSETRGYAGGPASTLWVTDDGGRNWTPRVLDTAISATICDIEFVDEMHGWVVAGYFFSSVIWSTSDGGETWTRKSANVIPHAIEFVDAQHGWIVGKPTGFSAGGPIAVTSDGGATWSLQATNRRSELYDVRFSGRFTGIAAGRDGVALRTTNGGVTWTDCDLPSVNRDTYFLGVETMDAGASLMLVGSDSVVLRSDDEGASWHAQGLPAGHTFHSVNFTSPLRGWLVGDGGSILWTFDGGETWLPFETGAASEGQTFNKVTSLDRDSVWVAGNLGDVRSFTNVGGE